MNKFEQHIKESLERFEAEYNPADWSDMQNRLNKAKAGKLSSIGKALLIAASVVATVGAVYYFSTTDKTGNVTVDNSANKNENIVVKAANETPNANTVSNAGQNNEVASSVNDHKSNAPVENNQSAQKNTLPEKSPVQVPENNIGNNAPVKEPVQPVADALPASSNEELSATFRTDVSKICEDAPVQFIVEKPDASCTYKWFFGDGETSAEQNPRHTFADAGPKNVKLVVTSSDKRKTEGKMKLMVGALPVAHIKYTSSDESKLLVNFEADADKVTEWKWDFGDKQVSAAQNPSHNYKKYGKYQVVLTAKSSTGCSAVFSQDLNLKLDLLAPDAFSPDGNGTNDTWMPIALLNGDYVFTLTISDKTGKAVFSTSDKNNAWDGQNAKAGDTFKWTALVKDKNGNEVTCQGLITIAK